MFLGQTTAGDDANLPTSDLLTHGVVLGRTGSGKSGLTIALIEEAALNGANVLVLDPKGDLANLALSLTTPLEFKDWSDNPTDAWRKHCIGLAENSLTMEDVENYREGVDVNIYSPGKTGPGAEAVNLFPRFKPGGGAAREVAMVLSSIAGISDPIDPAIVFMTKAVSHEWAQGRSLPMSKWPGILSKPPQHLWYFGGMALNDFFSKKKRTDLARTLIGFQHQSERWLTGRTLDLKEITSARKPSISVFSMRHLSEKDRQFFTALLLNKVVEFMFATESSEKLKLLVVLDEARGYLPPYPHNPPTKAPIGTILAQGRAQGIGMLIGTQNPMDLDYKALSNVGTWFVGRLRERDCARDLLSELSSRGIEPEDVADVPQRSFLLLDKRGEHRQFKTRWCLNHLFGPMSGSQLVKLKPEVSISAPTPRPKPPAPEVPLTVLYGKTRPTIRLVEVEEPKLIEVRQPDPVEEWLLPPRTRSERIAAAGPPLWVLWLLKWWRNFLTCCTLLGLFIVVAFVWATWMELS